jgi:beta-1,4-mannosyl-glycoprotein beta-1,4-N-acetylglucosaminyltransferase
MIYDCFTFFNELDLLEIRLNELDPYVDKFVIAECKKTFTFKEKPLYFEENKERFAKFLPKIVHVAMDFGGRGEWGNEFAQRNSIRDGLERDGAKSDDIVIVSDVDEMPNLKGFDFGAIGSGVAGFPMQYYYYHLNCKMSLEQTIIKAFRYDYLKYWSPHEMRGKEPDIVHDKMGWHFSYMGGPDRISEKINAFAHQDMNLPEYNNEHHIRARMERNEDLFNRGYSFEIVPIDESFPDELRLNVDKYKHLLKTTL